MFSVLLIFIKSIWWNILRLKIISFLEQKMMIICNILHKYQTTIGFHLPVFARTNLYYHSFVPATIRKWNELDESEKNLPLSIFKNNRKRKQGSQTFFNLGTRSSQVHMARLRMQCSNLNHHLCLRFIKDDPKCQCGHDVENSEHFLFIAVNLII